MPKILAITPYPNSSADTRYRIMQFIPFLNKNGYETKVRPFMNEELFKIYNKEGNTLKKYWLTMVRLVLRLIDVFFLAKNFDVIFIHKECFPFGPPLFEFYLKRINKKIIYDMDDAFWTHPSQFKQIGKRFKDENKIGKIIQIADIIFVGNDFLFTYALSFNKNVILVPTVVDTIYYQPKKIVQKKDLIIGWVGRWSSSDYLDNLLEAMEIIGLKYPNIKFCFIGANVFKKSQNFTYEIKQWSLSNEISDILDFDIGIMPLPNDEYSKGKCGFKLIQYMALGIPSIASPIGANNKIVSHEVNGFLAESKEDWINCLSLLIDNVSLRREIGKNGRKTIEEFYSVESVKNTFLENINSLINKI